MVSASVLTRLAKPTLLLPGAQQVTFVDVDDTICEIHGYVKQGVGYGYPGIKSLNAPIANVSMPAAAPVARAGRRVSADLHGDHDECLPAALKAAAQPSPWPATTHSSASTAHLKLTAGIGHRAALPAQQHPGGLVAADDFFRWM